MKLFDPIFKFLNRGHERSVRAKKNIAASFVLKGINIATGLLLVPLVLEYLDATRYGIWLTLASIVLWFEFFDVGLGHGLRNKLSESLAKGKKELSKKYISTTYAGLFIIAGGFFIIFLIVNHFLNWSLLLNTKVVPQDELNALALITFGFFAMRLVLKVLFSIILANQQPAFKDLIQTTGKIINLIVVYILLKTTKDSLLFLGIAYSVSPVLVLLISSLIFFTKKFRNIVPCVRSVDFRLFKDLFVLGSKFFIIQVAAVVLFSTDNMIITQLFSPAEVTPYQIAHRYFGIVMMGFAIVVTPYWSAATEAYTKGEIGWIKDSIRKLIKLWGLGLLVLILMLFTSDKVYEVWIGDRVEIPFILSLAWALFIGLQTLNTIFVHFLNGIGKIKLQLYTGIFSIIFNIPLSVLFAKYFDLGPLGVLIATSVSILLSVVLRVIQYNKIINYRAYGIWNA